MKYRLRIALFLLIWSAGGGPAQAAEGALAIAEENPLRPLWLREQLDLKHRAPLVQDPLLTCLLDELTTRLWAQCSSPLPVARVFVVQDAQANALTFPDGAIYLTTGMVAHARTQDQLAGVLAHEFIHYTRRHAMAALEQAPQAGRREGARVWLDEAELQADREGAALMHASGFCPQAAVALMADFAKDPLCREEAAAHCRPGALGQRLSRMKEWLKQQRPEGFLCGQDTAPQYARHIAPALLANASSALRQGLWSKARESIERYIEVRPNDPQAYYLQGEIAYRSGKLWDLAAVCYRKAIDLDASFSPAYRALGIIHYKAGRLRDARGFFETSLALAPNAAENDYIKGYLQLCSH